MTLAGAFAEPMTEVERAQFRELAERDPPIRRVRELWLAIGRRGGKDSIAAAIAVHAAICGNFQSHLRRGERAAILALAVDRAQAAIVHGYIRAYFDLPLLAPLVANDAGDTIALTNGVDITIATSSFRGIRGRTVALAILDEVAYWPTGDDYQNADVEVVGALIPALATLRAAGSMLIGISTTYARRGVLFDRWRQYHGKPDDSILVIRQPSVVYNPTLAEPALAAEIAEDIERDPERGAAEWLSQWRSDLAAFVDRAVVEAAVVPGRFELPPMRGVSYAAFTDPSGAAADSFCLSIAHADKGQVIVDCIREIRPPFSPEAVVAEFAALLKTYRISRVTGDRYAGEWPREQFRKHGIVYEVSERAKSAIYTEALPLLNSGRLELLDHPRLVAQLCSLERRVGRGTGRDNIDHPPGGHDDVANSVAGVCVLVGGRPDVIARWIRAFGGVPVAPSW